MVKRRRCGGWGEAHWDPGCWTSCMPVCPHHAHVNSRRSTGCVMSLFTTRGQCMRSSTMLSKQTFPPREGRPQVLCVCVCTRPRVQGMSLCISPCLCEGGGGINRSAREWRWANEQAKANFCVCMKPTTCLRGIFSIVFQHLQQGLFFIRSNIYSSHAFPNHGYTHYHRGAHVKYSNKHEQYSIRLIWFLLKVHRHGTWISQVINNFQQPYVKNPFCGNQNASLMHTHTHDAHVCVCVHVCMGARSFNNDVVLHLPLILRALEPANARLIWTNLACHSHAIFLMAWLTVHDWEAVSKIILFYIASNTVRKCKRIGGWGLG